MSHQRNLRDIVNTTWLRARAGKRSFDHGGAYFHSNTVQLQRTDDLCIEGAVDDSSLYAARIWMDGEAPRFSCTCDDGEQGVFCKHLVALGLTWLEQLKREPDAAFSGYPELQLLQHYLHSLPREFLVDLLLAQSERDASLRRQLQRLAARHVDGRTTPLQESVLKLISRLSPGMSAQRLAADVRDLADMLGDTRAAGHAALARSLGERALERATFAAQQKVDAAGNLAANLEALRAVLAQATSEAPRPMEQGPTGTNT